MPLARIRSFDPEAIAFLAAQLAQSGYTLQFVRPNETGLEEADLELTVVRRDVDAALQIAQTEAERLGADITVVPGAMPVPEPVVAADVPEPAPFPSEIEMPAGSEPAMSEVPLLVEQAAGHDFAIQRAHLAQIARESSERTAHVLGRGLGRAVDGLEVISDSIGRGLANGKENLAEIGDNTAGRFNQWKVRFLTERALRRQARQVETLSGEVGRAKVLGMKEVPRRPQPLWLRERIYMGVAVASILVAAAIIGWSFAGSGGPANPVGKGTGLSTVEEQMPFGPASVNAVAAPTAPMPVSEKSTTSKPKPAVIRHADQVRRASTYDDKGPEVIVRHFDQKPVAEQARTKTRDGVKIISEE